MIYLQFKYTFLFILLYPIIGTCVATQGKEDVTQTIIMTFFTSVDRGYTAQNKICLDLLDGLDGEAFASHFGQLKNNKSQFFQLTLSWPEFKKKGCLNPINSTFTKMIGRKIASQNYPKEVNIEINLLQPFWKNQYVIVTGVYTKHSPISTRFVIFLQGKRYTKILDLSPIYRATYSKKKFKQVDSHIHTNRRGMPNCFSIESFINPHFLQASNSSPIEELGTKYINQAQKKVSLRICPLPNATQDILKVCWAVNNSKTQVSSLHFSSKATVISTKIFKIQEYIKHKFGHIIRDKKYIGLFGKNALNQYIALDCSKEHTIHDAMKKVTHKGIGPFIIYYTFLYFPYILKPSYRH